MSIRVDVSPDTLQWAQRRSRRSQEDLAARFPKLNSWLRRDVRPTLKQLEQYAAATYTPFGYLLLDEPLAETVPVADFRTVAGASQRVPSAALLDTIHLCQQRQEWFRGFQTYNDVERLPFIGTMRLDDSPGEAAAAIRSHVSFEPAQRASFESWSDALRGLVDRLESAGVLVMISGIVGNNTHRRLDPGEFRGFALVDNLAPVIFVNGADAKAAQVFTLAHEAAHLWLGQSGVGNATLDTESDNAVERWCNRVAAEVLVPEEALRNEFRSNASLSKEVDRLARAYRVSTLVILRRLFDTTLISRSAFRELYDAENTRAAGRASTASGGNFYNTQPVRVSKRFAKALIGDTWEGNTLYRDAFRLLGVRRQSAFDELGQQLWAS